MKRAALALFLFCLARAARADAGAASGLTGPVDALVAARPRVTLRLGSVGQDVGDLVLPDFAGLLSCDDRLAGYLSDDGDHYYEALSAIIEETIRAKFGGDSGVLFAIVDSSGEDEVVHISVAVEYSRIALVPVYLETSGRELTVSFAIPCSLEFSALLSIRVDSATVLEQDAGRGCSASVDHFTVKLASLESDSPRTADVVYGNNPLTASVAECSLDAQCGWDLSGGREEAPGEDGEESEAGKTWLTYDDIARGDYEWRSYAFGAFRFALRAGTEGENGDQESPDREDDDSLEVLYETDEVSGDGSAGARVTVVDGGDSLSLSVAARGLRKDRD